MRTAESAHEPYDVLGRRSGRFSRRRLRVALIGGHRLWPGPAGCDRVDGAGVTLHGRDQAADQGVSLGRRGDRPGQGGRAGIDRDRSRENEECRWWI